MFDITYRRARRTDRCLKRGGCGGRHRSPQLTNLINALDHAPQVAMCSPSYPDTKALAKYFAAWGRGRDRRPKLSVRTLESQDGVLITRA